jgi:hypothetical protein
MKAINNLIKKVRAMERSINPTIRKTINSNKKAIRTQITERQWYLGVDADNEVIEPFYTPFTVELKNLAGQLSDRVTLRDTGALYRSITVKAHKETVSFDTNSPYFDDLQDKYDNNRLLGLNEDYINKFAKEEILPNVVDKFKQILSK